MNRTGPPLPPWKVDRELEFKDVFEHTGAGRVRIAAWAPELAEELWMAELTFPKDFGVHYGDARRARGEVV